MIPKIIHYIWLGKNLKPKNFGEVFESWIKFAASFEIKEWNENNISEFSLPDYFHKAMAEKRYAFASDVLRCHILYKYGGIYLDIDEKLFKDIPDDFLGANFFTAYYHGRKDYFGFGFLGLVKENFLMKDMINFYDNYDLKDGYEIINSIFSKILVQYLNKSIKIEKIKKEIEREIIDKKEMEKEMVYEGDEVDGVDEFVFENQKLKIFPEEYFYPEKVYGHNFEKAYAIHFGNTSWIPWYRKILYKFPFYNHLKSILKFLLPKNLQKKVFNMRYE